MECIIRDRWFKVSQSSLKFIRSVPFLGVLYTECSVNIQCFGLLRQACCLALAKPKFLMMLTSYKTFGVIVSEAFAPNLNNVS